MSDGRQSFTCPRCGRTSYHPDDVREGYCGYCHDWTGAVSSRWNRRTPAHRGRDHTESEQQ